MNVVSPLVGNSTELLRLTSYQLTFIIEDGSPITANSVAQLVEQNDATRDEITFVFDQSQEGSFSCRTALNETLLMLEELAGIVH